MAKDPIGFGGDGINLFCYVECDPLNIHDPEGEFGTVQLIGLTSATAIASEAFNKGQVGYDIFEQVVSAIYALAADDVNDAAIQLAGTALTALTLNKTVSKVVSKASQCIRSSWQKRKFLINLAKSGKAPKWMNQWLSRGKVPPGYNVEHKIPLSTGGSDTPPNMRLIDIDMHNTHHLYYHPWR